MIKFLERIDSWLSYHDPWYYWRKVESKFPPPTPCFVRGRFSGYFGLPISLKSYKGLQFHMIGLGWKMKWDKPVVEWNPIICFTWTNPWKTKVKSRFGDYSYNKIYWFGWTFVYFTRPSIKSYNFVVWEEILRQIIYKENEN